MRRALVLATVVALAAVSTAGAASITFRDTVPTGESRSITVSAQSRIAFEVVLRVPATGRTQLFLQGRRAPRGGPLIDTRTYRCPRTGAFRICRARYEALPPGTYTWRARRVAGPAGPIVLTVRW